MSLGFYPDNNQIAMENIKSGEYRKRMFEYLQKDNGQISWGVEETFVNSENVYDLFDLDADEYVGYEQMNTLKPSALAKAFKAEITAAYFLFLEWQQNVAKNLPGKDAIPDKSYVSLPLRSKDEIIAKIEESYQLLEETRERRKMGEIQPEEACLMIAELRKIIKVLKWVVGEREEIF